MVKYFRVKRRLLFYLIVILIISFAVILVIGHLFPQQFDNFGDQYGGPAFYGTQPS